LPVDGCQPPQHLGLQRVTGGEQLREILLDRSIRAGPDVLGPKLLDRRSQRAHTEDPTEHLFAT
jgi:hypothetical protein